MTAAVRYVEQQRGPGLGASIAAACLGMSPYDSPITAWLKLKGKKPDTSGPQAEWGTYLEPVVRGKYAVSHRVNVFVPDASLYHPDHPWLRCTPDGIVEGRHLLQVKTCDQRLRWHWFAAGSRFPSAPPHYRIQAVVEMAVTGLPRNDFAVLCGGNEYFEVIIERDAELEAMVVERLAAFWAGVETNRPPEIDDADDWRVYFADRLPKLRTVVVAPSSVEARLDEWKAARAALEKATKAEALAKNQIMAAFVEDGATTYETSHGRVLLIQSSSKAPYVKAPESWGGKDIIHG